MSDDRYLIPPPPQPEETQPALHPRERTRANIAIGVALFAAAFTGYQAYEAHETRIDARTASEQQKSDVERSRIAAEKSAEASNRSADAAWASVNKQGELTDAVRTQIQDSRRDFEEEHRPLITSADLSVAWLMDSFPRMDPQKPTNINVHWGNGGGNGSSCTLRSGGRFAKDKKEVLDTDYALFPAVMDISTNSKISYNMAVPVVASGLKPSDGDVKLYLLGKADCASTIGSSKRYHSEWCFYFPVANDGKIDGFIHGCKNPADIKNH